MVRPYVWLLDRAGDEGIRLTRAGYLPPAHVEAAATELGLLEDWMGKGNREIQTLPVLHLRETATKMGLLRKHRGTLLFTAAGRKLRTDPVSLWSHLADACRPDPPIAARHRPGSSGCSRWQPSAPAIRRRSSRGRWRA